MSTSKLQYMLQLIDDDSHIVREEIIKELKKYGSSLENDLKEFSNILNPDRMKILQPLIDDNRREWLLSRWNDLYKFDNDFEILEYSLNLISIYLYGINTTYDLTNMLDELTEEFKNKIPYGDELDLATFLFQEKKIQGAKDDYYNPFNSNLIYTIREKKGLPITLAAIYMLIGYRLGFQIKGCNFPGHFLAKIEIDDEIILVDCYNKGKFFYEQDIEELVKDSKVDIVQLIQNDASAITIIRRFLSNLVHSYSIINEDINRQFFTELLQRTV